MVWNRNLVISVQVGTRFPLGLGEEQDYSKEVARKLGCGSQDQEGKLPEGEWWHFRKRGAEWPQREAVIFDDKKRMETWKNPHRKGGCVRASQGLKLPQLVNGGSRGCKIVFEGAWQGKEQKMDG